VVVERFCLTNFGRTRLRSGSLLHVSVENLVEKCIVNSSTSRTRALMEKLRRFSVVYESLGVSLEESWLPSVAGVWAHFFLRMCAREELSLGAMVGTRLENI